MLLLLFLKSAAATTTAFHAGTYAEQQQYVSTTATTKHEHDATKYAREYDANTAVAFEQAIPQQNRSCLGLLTFRIEIFFLLTSCIKKPFQHNVKILHMKLTAVKYYCSDLGNPPQRAFAIRTSMNRVIFFIYSES